MRAVQYILELRGRVAIHIRWNFMSVWQYNYVLIENGSQNSLRGSNRRSRCSHSKGLPPSFAGENRSCGRLLWQMLLLSAPHKTPLVMDASAPPSVSFSRLMIIILNKVPSPPGALAHAHRRTR